MSSKQKRKVARQNGAKAAGSKSPEGLKKSSMNALRHGLAAETLVLSNECPDQFNEMLQSYILRFKPYDDVEMNLVYEMVSARWRQQRMWVIQSSTLDLQMDRQEQEIEETMLKCSEPTRLGIAFTTLANEQNTLELMMRYETSYSRMHDRAMKALERLQEARLQEARLQEAHLQEAHLQEAHLQEARSQEIPPEQKKEDHQAAPPVIEVKPEPAPKPAVPTTSEPPQLEKQNLRNEADPRFSTPCVTPIPIPGSVPPTPNM